MSCIAISCGLGAVQLTDPVVTLVLQTAPQVTGSVVEDTFLNVDTTDTWMFSQQPATVEVREYRLMIDGAVAVTGQTNTALPIPPGTGGGTYTCEMRVSLTSGFDGFSNWVEVSEGQIGYSAPQAVGSINDIDLSAGDADYNIDLDGYFSGSDLTYAVHSAPVLNGSSLNGSVLTLSGGWLIDPNEIVLRASNPAGHADQAFMFEVTSTGPAFNISSTPESELEITGVTGNATLMVAAPAEFASYDVGQGPGIFPFDVADLGLGPITLAPCRLSVSQAVVGETVSVIPGLIAYDATTPEPVITYEWVRDGAVIAGETGQTYTVLAGDVGSEIACLEFATGLLGAIASLSATAGVSA